VQFDFEPLRLGLGAGLAFLVAGGGYAARALTAGGAVGAVVVGTAVFGVGGVAWGVLLVVFFVSSSLLTRWRAGAKAGAAVEFEKGGRRDLGQVLANGGIPAALALLAALRPGFDAFPALVGAIAVATADTWATELGLLSRASPRLITTGRRVAPGTSGAISPLGLTATVAGGTMIGVVAVLALVLPTVLTGGGAWESAGISAAHAGAPGLARLIPLAIIAALAGSLLDSFLGATLQGLYHCAACGVETERRVHRCGAWTERLRGWAFLTNDRVNLVAIMMGAAVGWLLD
jgi:uncharacterized protein (TIGR00297 family)